MREKPPQRVVCVSSHRVGAFYFSQIYTEEQNTQRPTETLSQPISQSVTANLSWKASVADEKQLTKDGRLVSKPVLVYPFLTEAWERNINETKPYYIDDMW